MTEKRVNNKRKKILLVSSSGGHFEQLNILRGLKKNFDIVVVTEKTKYNQNNPAINYFLPQVNRKELPMPVKMSSIFAESSKILKIEKPDAVIGTGALATLPMIYLAKKSGIKTIHFESFAKINSPTMTGNFIYKHKLADKFYVQWKPMLKIYPDAVYVGGIY